MAAGNIERALPRHILKKVQSQQRRIFFNQFSHQREREEDGDKSQNVKYKWHSNYYLDFAKNSILVDTIINRIELSKNKSAILRLINCTNSLQGKKDFSVLFERKNIGAAHLMNDTTRHAQQSCLTETVGCHGWSLYFYCSPCYIWLPM